MEKEKNTLLERLNKMGRKKESIPHPNATVLYKVGISGKLKEVFRWNEEDHKET